MKNPRALTVVLVFTAAFAPTRALAAEPPAAALGDLAPTGKLRVTFIASNPVQVVKDAGGLRGPAIDLGRELAKRLGVPFEPLGHPRAADIVASARSGAWDIAFLAFDPERADAVDFSPAYLEAHNEYLAPARSPVRSFADADRAGVRIGVGQNDAVDLHLTRALKSATLVRNPGGTPGALDLVRAGKVDLYAANRQRLDEMLAQLPGSRVIEGSVLAVRPAIPLPKGPAARPDYMPRL